MRVRTLESVVTPAEVNEVVPSWWSGLGQPPSS